MQVDCKKFTFPWACAGGKDLVYLLQYAGTEAAPCGRLSYAHGSGRGLVALRHGPSQAEPGHSLDPESAGDLPGSGLHLAPGWRRPAGCRKSRPGACSGIRPGVPDASVPPALDGALRRLHWHRLWGSEGISASGGARMQEGILSLMQMARTTAAINLLKGKNLPYISIMTDPTTGGVSASFAMLGDIHMAEKGCIIGFAGARVIEQTIRETLPEGFQRAEYLQKHGMVDIVFERPEMKKKLVKVLELLLNKKK